MPFGTHLLPFVGADAKQREFLFIYQDHVARAVLVCRSAAGAFVEVGPDWQVACHWKPEAPYNVTFLQGKDCSLFARKMSVHAKLQVLRLRRPGEHTNPPKYH